MNQLSILGNLFKNEKEKRVLCKYHIIKFDPIHGDSITIPFQKDKKIWMNL